MAFYWKVRKLDYFMAAIELKKIFNELSECDSAILSDKLRGSHLYFYRQDKEKTPIWIRFTLPFAFVLLLLMIVFMPISYIITGEWGYKNKFVLNWMNKLGFN